jgi:hypothetical protein
VNQKVPSTAPTGLQSDARTPSSFSALNTPTLSTSERYSPIRSPSVVST